LTYRRSERWKRQFLRGNIELLEETGQNETVNSRKYVERHVKISSFLNVKP